MKKLIILVIVVGGVVGVYLWVSSLRLSMPGAAGKVDKFFVGDLVIPINATGEIRPAARLEVKSEASGEVIEIAKNAGERARVGDLLIRLAPEDETRSVKRSQAELTRAAANLDQSKLAVQDRQSRVTTAIAERDRIKAQLDQAAFDLKRVERMDQQDVTYPAEVSRAKTTFQALDAQHRGAVAGVELSELAVQQAEKDVIAAETAHDIAKQNLADAEERLKETEIRSKVNGVVSEMNVEVGDVIQSGKAVVGGGTILAVIADISKTLVRTEIQEAEIGQIIDLAPPEARPQFGDEPVSAANTPSSPSPVSGSPVSITVDAFPDEKFSGVIERVYPEPRKIRDIVTYLVDVRVSSDNRSKLMLGMQANVDFTLQSLEDVLLVRQKAVRMDKEGRKGVYVPGKQKAEEQETPPPEFVPCQFGLTDGLNMHVVDCAGLKEGDRVYVELPRQMDEDEDQE